ncbi:MAG: cell division GTPase [Moraxellaceae bacterium]|jgi:cell division GTPase FtsZ|nr:cell division GTPase [Moraxellaceae bacterium]
MNTLFNIHEASSAVITIVGVGHWGCERVAALPSDLSFLVRLVAVHGDLTQLAENPARTLVLLEGTLPDLQEGNAAPGSPLALLREATTDADLVLLIGDPEDDAWAVFLSDLASWCAESGKLTRSITPPHPALSGVDMRYTTRARCLPIEVAIGRSADMSRLVEAFCYALCSVILNPSPIAIDFSDVRIVLDEPGRTLIALGRASGSGRAEAAVHAAVASHSDLARQLFSASAVMAVISAREEVGLDEFTAAAEALYCYLATEPSVLTGIIVNPALTEAEMEVVLIVTSYEDMHSTPVDSLDD